MTSADNSRSSFGWQTPLVILICGCLIALIGFGPRSSLGLFLTPVTQEKGWGRDIYAFALALQMLLWGAARAEGAGLVARQWANIGGLRPAWSWELWPRLVEGARLWRLALGWPLLALGGATLAGVALLRQARARLGAADGLLALFVVAYLLLHWLWAVPAWDRYLLPVLPIVAALLGRGVEAVAGLKREGTTDSADFADYQKKKSA